MTGVLDYFPDALVEVARVSKVGNDQHNPGQPLHWDRSKSTDHADCIVRHLLERGTLDSDGMRHTAKVAWRALALLQTELEGERGAGLPENVPEERELRSFTATELRDADAKAFRAAEDSARLSYDQWRSARYD